jgi:hypothetical protein
MELVLLDRCDAESIDTVSLVDGMSCIPSLAVNVFRTESPVVLGIFAREGIAILLADGSPGSRPPEGTDTQSRDRHDP